MTERHHFLVRMLTAALCCAALPACALTSKADALSPRYFSPEPTNAVNSPKAAKPYELRLGAVSAAAHLDERIAYRVGASELGFYEAQRWTENPEQYLRRALERDLFEQRGLSRIVGGDALTLDVELTEFEELRGEPLRARVSLTFQLRDDHKTFVQRTLHVERSITPRPGTDAAQSLAGTLAETLDDTVRQLGDQLVAALPAASSSEAQQSPVDRLDPAPR